ncbi:MAG: M4 family metallopeptidase [Saprospiraceae bacterium]|nr:M4 family metallopeptidase [Saprospiraceae bacterium]
MKKFYLFLMLFGSFLNQMDAQVLKKIIFDGNIELPKSPKVLRKGNNSSGRGLYFQKPINSNIGKQKIQNFHLKKALGKIADLRLDENGHPIWLETNIELMPRNSETKKELLEEILLNELGVKDSGRINYQLSKIYKDELGIEHVQMHQHINGVEVLDGEFRMHLYPSGKLILHGRMVMPNEAISLQRGRNFDINKVLDKFYSAKGILPKNSTHSLVSTGIQSMKNYYWRHPDWKSWHLISLVKVTPNLQEHWELYIDCQTGDILKSIKNTCSLFYNHSHNETCKSTSDDLNESIFPGPEMGSGFDLLNQRRDFGIWREGGLYYLIDATKPMFDAQTSRIPNSGVGVIVTLDGLFKSASSNEIDYITSPVNSWSSAVAVSAHCNAGVAYDYFLTTFGRNSIANIGDNIVSVINITEDNGQAMDNAFWNGKAIFYGNGNKAFTSLPKALDVAGHELTHGVIQNEANLVYENESGAINESMADIFGIMMDRNDWTVGEEVVLKSFFPSGAMRSFSDPHNGGSSLNDPGWQPKHVNEQYKGTLDNGGVHINSGILNYAFYLMCTKLAESRSVEGAKIMAEKIYYRALTQYLMRNSDFKDLRAAIELSCVDWYPTLPDVLASAIYAFDKVGILNPGPTTPPDRSIEPNSGKEYLICTNFENDGVYLYDFVSIPVKISNRRVYSKPSVTDNGQEIFYVGEDKKLYQLYYDSITRGYVDFEVDDTPIYRNVAISKNGRHLAILYNTQENKIHIYDFVTETYKTFVIYNPTSSGGATYDVLFADQMDFDLSGQYLMYDAFSVISNSGIEYWDIAFLRFFDQQTDDFGDGNISKLIAKLPENTSVGNPVFSKNSPDVLAFDYIESEFFSTSYALLGINLEQNTASSIADNRDRLAYASYGVKDNAILYDSRGTSNEVSIGVKPLASNKISSAGPENIILKNAKWGSWFATGNRKLVNAENISTISEISIAPNPFEEGFYLNLDSKMKQSAILKIYEVTGRSVRELSIELTEGPNQFFISGMELTNGLHYLNIQIKDGVKSIKIFKNN